MLPWRLFLLTKACLSCNEVFHRCLTSLTSLHLNRRWIKSLSPYETDSLSWLPNTFTEEKDIGKSSDKLKNGVKEKWRHSQSPSLLYKNQINTKEGTKESPFPLCYKICSPLQEAVRVVDFCTKICKGGSNT